MLLLLCEQYTDYAPKKKKRTFNFLPLYTQRNEIDINLNETICHPPKKKSFRPIIISLFTIGFLKNDLLYNIRRN